jgi:hypothetical protein
VSTGNFANIDVKKCVIKIKAIFLVKIRLFFDPVLVKIGLCFRTILPQNKTMKTMKKLSKSLIGHLVALEFWDHKIMEGPDLILCHAFGVLHSIDKEKVVLMFWDCPMPGLEGNREFTTILRSAIKGVLAHCPFKA